MFVPRCKIAPKCNLSAALGHRWTGNARRERDRREGRKGGKEGGREGGRKGAYFALLDPPPAAAGKTAMQSAFFLLCLPFDGFAASNCGSGIALVLNALLAPYQCFYSLSYDTEEDGTEGAEKESGFTRREGGGSVRRGKAEGRLG
eukprot:3261844-Rhodomonas_salina.1